MLATSLKPFMMEVEPMVTFGRELASLYEKIGVERHDRANLAAERSAGVAAIASETKELLRQANADRAALAKNARLDAESLRARLAEQMAQLHTDMSQFRADARAAAAERSDARQAAASDLNTRLATFSKSLREDTATFLVDAQSLRVENFSDLSARLSDVVKSTQDSVSELRAAIIAELKSARGLAPADQVQQRHSEAPTSDEPSSEKTPMSDATKPVEAKKQANDPVDQVKVGVNASANTKGTQADSKASGDAAKSELTSKSTVRNNKSS